MESGVLGIDLMLHRLIALCARAYVTTVAGMSFFRSADSDTYNFHKGQRTSKIVR